MSYPKLTTVKIGRTKRYEKICWLRKNVPVDGRGVYIKNGDKRVMIQVLLDDDELLIYKLLFGADK
jgi:hypothetical protein